MTTNMLLFIILSYLISWIVWISSMINGGSSQWLQWIAGFGPTLSALMLTIFRDGINGLKPLMKWRGNVQLKWYLFSLLGTPLVVVLSLGLHVGLGGVVPSYVDQNHMITSIEQWPLIVVVFIYIFVFTALGEEIGWRGYLLPRLQAAVSPFTASTILGVVWAVWHLPLFWIAGNFHKELPLSWFLLQVIGSTFIYTWLYNRTEGKLLICLLFHTANNAAIGLLPVLPQDVAGSVRPLWLMVGLLWIFVGLIGYLERKMFFSIKEQKVL